MYTTKARLMSIVFFCLIGWVYTGQAVGQNGGEPVKSDVFKQPANPAGDLFKQEEQKDPTAANTSEPDQGDTAGDATSPPSEEISDEAVKVGDFGEIDLHVKELDIATVLQLLSIQSKRNIIATREVAGTITADLYQVDFYDAMAAILEPNGFGYREKGKFIYVYTTQQLAELQKAEEKPVIKVIRLDYINAKDASTFVTPLLSTSGSIGLSGDVPTSFSPSTTDGGMNSSSHMDTLVVRDLQGNVDQIVGLIKELDVRPSQVRIKATVLKADITEFNNFGVDITVLGGGVQLEDFANPVNALSDLQTGVVKPATRSGGFTSTPSSVAQNGSSVKFGFVAGSVEAFVTALDQITDTTVLANPEVLVLNRQRADLLVGKKVGYISTTQTETSATQTVEFLDVGTQLTVRPFISSDGTIRMELRPAISTGGANQIGNLVIPSTETQELTTNVMVKNGQTIVIGGLFEESTTVARKQVPGLGDIPIVGTAFKGQDDNIKKSEIIFLVTPVIVKDEDLFARGKRAADSAELAMYGARQALLPWSRTKLEASHINDARRYLKEGDDARAMLAARAALNVNSTSVDARRMLMKLANENYKLYNRSILDESANSIINAHIVNKGVRLNLPGNTKAAEGKSLFDDSFAGQDTKTAKAGGEQADGQVDGQADEIAQTKPELPISSGVTSDDVPQNLGTSHTSEVDAETAKAIQAVEDLFKKTEEQSDNENSTPTQTAGVETDD